MGARSTANGLTLSAGYHPSSPRVAARNVHPADALVLAGMGSRGPPDIGGLISVKVDNFPFEMTCAHPQHRDARCTPPTALSPRPSASAGHRRCSPQE